MFTQRQRANDGYIWSYIQKHGSIQGLNINDCPFYDEGASSDWFRQFTYTDSTWKNPNTGVYEELVNNTIEFYDIVEAINRVSGTVAAGLGEEDAVPPT